MLRAAISDQRRKLVFINISIVNDTFVSENVTSIFLILVLINIMG